MRRASAAIGTTVFFFVAPGVVAFLVPYLIAQWQSGSWQFDPPVTQWLAVVLGVVGTIALIECFVRFVIKGVGTPAPIAPTEHLVVTGLYRLVRNPMYVAVLMIVIAQGLSFASIAVLVYAALLWVVLTAFVMTYEEPTLAATYGEEYATYRRNVRRWIPRLIPWKAPAGGERQQKAPA